MTNKPLHIHDVLSALDTWARLRELDCVTIDTCFAPHGDQHFVWLGEGEDKKCIATGNGLIGALIDATKWMDELNAK